MREQGSESHEELLKETGMFTLGETQMADDSYSSKKRDESQGDPDCRPLSAGALRQLPHSLYHRSTLSAHLRNTILVFSSILEKEFPHWIRVNVNWTGQTR